MSKADNARDLLFYERRLKRLRRELARRTEGGTNWNKTKLRIQKTHEKLANIHRNISREMSTEEKFTHCYGVPYTSEVLT